MTSGDDATDASLDRWSAGEVARGPYGDQFVLDTHLRVPFMRRFFERRRAERRARLMARLWRE